MATLTAETAKRVLRPAKRAYSVIEKRLYSIGALSANGLPLPDFLGIGSAQSGTSWLWENLKAHPDVIGPRIQARDAMVFKEVHYFDRNFHWLLREYAELFEAGRGKVKGEVTPGYSILRLDRIRFIRRVMPDVKLVIILRDPVERAWSAARRIMTREASARGVAFEDIDEAEVREYLLKEHEYKPERGNVGDYEPGLRRGNYLRILDNWLAVFSEHQLLICFFDDLMVRPQSLLTRVFRHIGVSTDVDWQSLPVQRVVNKNPTRPLPHSIRVFLQDLYRKDIEGLFARFGDAVEGWRC